MAPLHLFPFQLGLILASTAALSLQIYTLSHLTYVHILTPHWAGPTGSHL